MLATSGKMLLTEHKKAKTFSHAIMADVKDKNKHLHFSDNFKYGTLKTYLRFFKKVSQLNHSIEYCTWNSYPSSGMSVYFLIPSTFWRTISSHHSRCYMYALVIHYHSISVLLFFQFVSFFTYCLKNIVVQFCDQFDISRFIERIIKVVPHW